MLEPIFRYHMQVSGQDTEFTEVARTAKAAIALLMMTQFRRRDISRIEQWPEDPNRYEVSSGPHRVATVTITQRDE